VTRKEVVARLNDSSRTWRDLQWEAWRGFLFAMQIRPYRGLGFAADEVLSMGKRLVVDEPFPGGER
jgi:hypothetical protein